MTGETEIAADVIIVGLGPVGATLANLLGRYGVSTLVVEADAQMARFPRAIALDNEALRILQMAGLGEGAFPTTVIPYVQMRSPIFGAYARGNTDGLVDGHPKLVTFYQPDLEDALRSALESHACVRVMTGVRVTDVRDSGSEVRLTLAAHGTTHTAVAKYVVGCDGAASAVRGAVGIAMQGESYPQDWLVVDTKNVSDAIEHVEFWCDPARPSPRMPRRGGVSDGSSCCGQARRAKRCSESPLLESSCAHGSAPRTSRSSASPSIAFKRASRTDFRVGASSSRGMRRT